ncbi:hypothetical protein [Loktanella sp. S4079]|uniref:hypothetical protein n=1 Tax=Loktanella sp. S4079 TaxID=579483 RepID=UPI000A51FB9D|nr:hypothetical protein [Loktanella sp. S4079]
MTCASNYLFDRPQRLRRYSVNPMAFVAALILAPCIVTLLTCWTLIGLFAPIFGVIPYLVIGTPILLWAVGHIRPAFWPYAALGFAANLFCLIAAKICAALNVSADADDFIFIFAFGLVFGALYAGAFGSLYAKFHPNLHVLDV